MPCRNFLQVLNPIVTQGLPSKAEAPGLEHRPAGKHEARHSEMATGEWLNQHNSFFCGVLFTLEGMKTELY